MKNAAVIAVSLLLLLTGCTTSSRLMSGRSGPAAELTAEERQFAQALAHYGQGLLHQGEQGRFSDEAFEAFAAAVEADPSAHRVASRVALGYLFRNRTADAVRALEESCAELPDSVQARVDLALVYQMVGRADEAISSYSKAIRLAPHRDVLYVELAGLMFNEQRDELALRTVRTGLRNGELKDPLIVFSYRRALQFMGTGEHRRAIACFRTVLAFMEAEGRGPLSARFFYLYGSACEQAGESAEAERIFLRCIALYPDSHAVLNYLAYMWAEQGVKLDEALDLVLRAIEKDAANAAYIDTLGWVYYKQKRYDLAVKHLQRAFDLVDNDPTIANHLGDAFYAQNQMEMAAILWRISLTLDPKNAALVEKLERHGITPPAALPGEEAVSNE